MDYPQGEPGQEASSRRGKAPAACLLLDPALGPSTPSLRRWAPAHCHPFLSEPLVTLHPCWNVPSEHPSALSTVPGLTPSNTVRSALPFQMENQGPVSQK